MSDLRRRETSYSRSCLDELKRRRHERTGDEAEALILRPPDANS